MATFVVCTRCGRTRETFSADELPTEWKRLDRKLLCPRCADPEATGDVLDEEVIYPDPDRQVVDESFDTLDEGFCEVCSGPCQGH